jgi:hypothetical protein
MRSLPLDSDVKARLTPEYLGAHGFPSREVFLACGRVPPHGTVTKIIKSSGGDYATTTAWEAALTADHSEDQTGTIEEADWDASAAATLSINVSNSTSKVITLTVTDGYRFTNDANWPDCHQVEQKGGWCQRIFVYTPNVVLEWLGLQCSTSSSLILVRTGATDLTVRYCINWGSDMLIRGYQGPHSVVAHHIMGWGSDNRHVTCEVAGSTVEVYSCTFLGGVYGLIQSGGTMTAQNVICLSQSTACFSGTIGGSYNMATDTSAPGTSPWNEVTASAIIEDTGSGTENLHLDSAVTAGAYEGADPTGIGTVDIDGATIYTWDIGADTIGVEGEPGGGGTSRLLGGGLINGGKLLGGILINA